MSKNVEQTALTKLSLGRQFASRRKLQLTGCAVLLIAAVIFTAGSGFGYMIGRLSNDGETAGSTVVAAETDRTLTPDDLDIFWEAMELVEDDYYGELPSPNERSYGAIRGVLETLDDRNHGFSEPG